MLMRDVEIGATVFLDEDMSDDHSRERRETYYRRNGTYTYLRLGIVQGDPALATPRIDEFGKPEKPRYIRFIPEGYEYPIVAALPVKPLTDSRFWQYVGAAPAPLAETTEQELRAYGQVSQENK